MPPIASKRGVPDVTIEQIEKQHQMWQAYIKTSLQNLRSPSAAILAQMLQQLDRHGCWMKVVRSRSTSHVGVAGFAVMETSRTIALLASSAKKPVVALKVGTTLEMALPSVTLQQGALPPSVLISGEALVRQTS